MPALCSGRGCGLSHGHAGPCDGAALGEIADVASPGSAIKSGLAMDIAEDREQLGRAQAHAELEAATIQLRDAGVLLRKSQQRYKEALDAFNRAVAPEVK